MGELKHPTAAWIIIFIVPALMVFGVPSCLEILGVFK